MRVTHKSAILFSGAIWMVIGVILLLRGLFYLLAEPQGLFSLVAMMKLIIPNTESCVLFLMGVALLLGTLKGRYILSRTAAKVVHGILMRPTPFELLTVYGWRYYLIIISMISIGVLLRLSPLSQDTKGFIDMTIGAALCCGALVYFRSARLLRETRK